MFCKNNYSSKNNDKYPGNKGENELSKKHKIINKIIQYFQQYPLAFFLFHALLLLEFVLLQEDDIEDDEGSRNVEEEPPLHCLHVGGGGDGSCNRGVQGVQDYK